MASAEVFKMNQEYRQSEEYKTLIKNIKTDCPWLPQSLCEYAIISHKTNPQAYKKDKNAKNIMKEPAKQPTNDGEIVVKDAIEIGELTNDIIEQRNEFFQKHMIKEKAEFIPSKPQPQTHYDFPKIEEVYDNPKEGTIDISEAEKFLKNSIPTVLHFD